MRAKLTTFAAVIVCVGCSGRIGIYNDDPDGDVTEPIVECDPHCDQPCGEQNDNCLPLAASDRGVDILCVAMARDDDGGYAGDPCEFANGCRPGFICMLDESSHLVEGRCRALCDPFFAFPGPDCDPTCEFFVCGPHRGELGDETCQVPAEAEEFWLPLNVGVCLSP